MVGPPVLLAASHCTAHHSFWDGSLGEDQLLQIPMPWHWTCFICVRRLEHSIYSLAVSTEVPFDIRDHVPNTAFLL